MQNINAFDKGTAELLEVIENNKNVNLAEQFIQKNLDDVQTIVNYPSGTCRLEKIVQGKDVKYYDTRGSFVDVAKSKGLIVKQIQHVTELHNKKEVDAVIVVNEAEKSEDVQLFIDNILKIKAKKHFIVMGTINPDNGDNVDYKRIENINSTGKKIINNKFNMNAIKEISQVNNLDPFIYTQAKDKKGNLIPDVEGISNCVVFAKQDNSKAKEKEIKKESLNTILENEVKSDEKVVNNADKSDDKKPNKSDSKDSKSNKK
jgi:hypothetical protein